MSADERVGTESRARLVADLALLGGRLALERFGSATSVAPARVEPAEEDRPSAPRHAVKNLAKAQAHLVVGFQGARLSDPLPAKGERKTGSARPPASAMRQREEKSSGGGAFAAAMAKAQERRKGA